MPGPRASPRPDSRAVGEALSLAAVGLRGARTGPDIERIARFRLARECLLECSHRLGLTPRVPAAPASIRPVPRSRGASRSWAKAAVDAVLARPGASFEARSLSHIVGTIHERSLEWSIDDGGVWRYNRRALRAKMGAFYTPGPLVDRVLSLAWQALAPAPGSIVRVCDPACGSGNFLIAAIARGLDGGNPVRADGADTDEIAAWLAVASVRTAFDLGNNGRASIRARAGNGLIGASPGVLRDAQPLAPSHGPRLDWRHAFDLVIGNPPFLGQLGTRTSRDRDLACYLKEISDGVITGYADTAAAFLWRAVTLTRPGGVIALVVPGSILGARDARPVREFVGSTCQTLATELIDDAAFDAGARPCILVLRRHATAADRGNSRAPRGQDVPAEDIRIIEPRPTRTLGAICTATADFRDEYYGLLPFVVEDHAGELDDARFPRLITCGMIEPGRSLWGVREIRLHKRRWLRPRADLNAMRQVPFMAAWSVRRLVPKVLVATQTRSIECVTDEHGLWLPVTPVLTVVPRTGAALQQIERALSDPETTVAARRVAIGTGMSAQVFRLSARQLEQLPFRDHEDLASVKTPIVARSTPAPGGGSSRVRIPSHS